MTPSSPADKNTNKQDAAEQPVEDLSFEDALNELEEIVRDLESARAPLEKSIIYYERGVALRKHCERKLLEAQTRIEKISVKDGEVTTEPFTSQ